MRFSVAALIAFVPALVSAANITVMVGQGGALTYTPNNITAAIGDFVEFQFMAGNHTVTQSTLADPCTQFKNATTGEIGLNSKYQAVAASSTDFPVWTIQIAASTPIWMFCLQGPHCQKGMVMSINANATSFAAFQAKAMTTTSSTPATEGSSDGQPAASGGALALVRPGAAVLASVAVLMALL